MRIVVCLPTYNERSNLEAMIRSLGEVFAAQDFAATALIIDDNSPDGTGELADRLASGLPYVDVLHRPKKEGLGLAYLAGFAWALEAGADLVIGMDCDFSHDPNDIPRLVAAAEDADLVLGSRYAEGGGTKNWGMLRQFVSRSGSLYARVLLGVPIDDLTGGFKCYRREALSVLPLEEISSRGYAFQIETTYRILQAGFRVVEIPILFEERRAGRSKMSRAIVIEAVLGVPKLRARKLRRSRQRQKAGAGTSGPMRSSTASTRPVHSSDYSSRQAATLRRVAKASNYNSWLFDRCRPYLGTTVLDVGAGLGTFTELCSEDRELVIALEPDPALYGELSARFEGYDNVVTANADVSEFAAGAGSQSIDSAICLNVLEHIPDDGEALRAICELLSPGGCLLLLVPAHPFLFGAPDRVLEHQRRYRQDALRLLLETYGFAVEDIRCVNPVGALGWLVNARILQRAELPGMPLKAYDRLVPALRVLDRVRLPIGLSVWAVARKSASGLDARPD